MKGGKNTVGYLATCMTYAAGSLLSILIAQSMKMSQECAAAAVGAAVATAGAVWLAKVTRDVVKERYATGGKSKLLAKRLSSVNRGEKSFKVRRCRLTSG